MEETHQHHVKRWIKAYQQDWSPNTCLKEAAIQPPVQTKWARNSSLKHHYRHPRTRALTDLHGHKRQVRMKSHEAHSHHGLSGLSPYSRSRIKGCSTESKPDYNVQTCTVAGELVFVNITDAPDAKVPSHPSHNGHTPPDFKDFVTSLSLTAQRNLQAARPILEHLCMRQRLRPSHPICSPKALVDINWHLLPKAVTANDAMVASSGIIPEIAVHGSKRTGKSHTLALGNRWTKSQRFPHHAGRRPLYRKPKAGQIHKKTVDVKKVKNRVKLPASFAEQILPPQHVPGFVHNVPTQMVNAEVMRWSHPLCNIVHYFKHGQQQQKQQQQQQQQQQPGTSGDGMHCAKAINR